MKLLATVLLLAAPQTLEQHGCVQCHVDLAPPGAASATKTCAGCHRELSSGAMDSQADRYGPEVWQRFKRRTAQHFVNVPPLSGVSRLRASWVQAYLAAPFDVRPRLSETMIRNRLTAAERAELARHFGAQADEPPPRVAPSAARLREGERRFSELGCAACHFAAAGPVARAQALAPDLGFTRERMNHSAVVKFLLQPSKEMPMRAKDVAEAQLLADYVYFAQLPREARVAVEPPPFDAGVAAPTYDEVEARVFKAVCWHCHSNPDKAQGNGGPGMSGGFGYPARGLSFASFEEVMTGSRDELGRPQSIFRKGTSGEPVLLEVLRARYVEERGAVDAGAPLGMPMGLPALAPEDFALVERWVRGGRRPARPGAKSSEAPSPMDVLRPAQP